MKLRLNPGPCDLIKTLFVVIAMRTQWRSIIALHQSRTEEESQLFLQVKCKSPYWERKFQDVNVCGASALAVGDQSKGHAALKWAYLTTLGGLKTAMISVLIKMNPPWRHSVRPWP